MFNIKIYTNNKEIIEYNNIKLIEHDLRYINIVDEKINLKAQINPKEVNKIEMKLNL